MNYKLRILLTVIFLLPIQFFASKTKLYECNEIIDPEVWVQMWIATVAREVSVFGIQGMIMSGGSLANTWVNDAAKQQFDALNSQVSAYAADLNSYMTNLSNNQQALVKKISDAFGTKENDLVKQYSQINQQQAAEISYLFQSINLDSPIQYTLSPEYVYWDELFNMSVMYTPGTIPWYNVVSWKGNWGFNKDTNSFWQYLADDFGTSPHWTTTGGSGDYPEYNAIFTEYATGKISYDIEVECNLVSCQYPFFAGIMFNRARWISGDPERLFQYRLVGLYGTQSKDENSRIIDICFAQQILQLPQKSGNKEQIISPTQQMATDNSTHFYSLSKDEIASLDKNPTTFIFKITTHPTSIDIAISKKVIDAQNTISIHPITDKTISGLESYLFQFGGIGFMAPGCQASFKIIQPQELIFTDADLKLYGTTGIKEIKPIPQKPMPKRKLPPLKKLAYHPRSLKHKRFIIGQASPVKRDRIKKNR